MKMMDAAIAAAIIAAFFALISTIISLLGQSRTKKLEHLFLKERETESKEAKLIEIVTKYRNPILRAAIDLKRRLVYYIQEEGLSTDYRKSTKDREYIINNTIFLIAEYFCWVEILRREVQFLDFGQIESNRKFTQLLREISWAFMRGMNDHSDFVLFRIYNGEQRAIGEIMIKSSTESNKHGYECIGYAEFVMKLEEKEFGKWLLKLKNDLEKNAKAPHKGDKRLILIHDAFIDLINFLDPEFSGCPKEEREKLQQEKTALNP